MQTVLMPRLEDLYDSALAHYSAGHRSIDVLLEIEARLLDLKLMRSELQSTHDMYRAYLEALAVESTTIRSLWEE